LELLFYQTLILEAINPLFSENKEAYKEKSKRFGKNILFTDDLSLSSTEIVRIYSEKNIVEEQIKNLKDTHIIRFTPMWCWTDKMIRIHAFTCVMALLFLRLLVKKVHDADPQMSQNEILEQLRGIKLTLLTMPRTGKVIPKITRLNDQQKQLLKLFKLKDYA
jgi:transposase